MRRAVRRLVTPTSGLRAVVKGWGWPCSLQRHGIAAVEQDVQLHVRPSHPRMLDRFQHLQRVVRSLYKVLIPFNLWSPATV